MCIFVIQSICLHTEVRTVTFFETPTPRTMLPAHSQILGMQIGSHREGPPPSLLESSTAVTLTPVVCSTSSLHPWSLPFCPIGNWPGNPLPHRPIGSQQGEGFPVTTLTRWLHVGTAITDPYCTCQWGHCFSSYKGCWVRLGPHFYASIHQ